MEREIEKRNTMANHPNPANRRFKSAALMFYFKKWIRLLSTIMMSPIVDNRSNSFIHPIVRSRAWDLEAVLAVSQEPALRVCHRRTSERAWPRAG